MKFLLLILILVSECAAMIRIPAGSVKQDFTARRPSKAVPGAVQVKGRPLFAASRLPDEQDGVLPTRDVFQRRDEFEPDRLIQPVFQGLVRLGRIDDRPDPIDENRVSSFRPEEPELLEQPLLSSIDERPIAPIEDDLFPSFRGQFDDNRREDARPVTAGIVNDKLSHTDSLREHLNAVDRIRQLQQFASLQRGQVLPRGFQGPFPRQLFQDNVRSPQDNVLSPTRVREPEDYDDDDLSHAQALEKHREAVNQAILQQRFAAQPLAFQHQQFVPANHFLQPPLPVHPLPLSHFSIPGAERHRAFTAQLQQAENALRAFHG